MKDSRYELETALIKRTAREIVDSPTFLATGLALEKVLKEKAHVIDPSAIIALDSLDYFTRLKARIDQTVNELERLDPQR